MVLMIKVEYNNLLDRDVKMNLLKWRNQKHHHYHHYERRCSKLLDGKRVIRIETCRHSGKQTDIALFDACV